MQAVANAWQGFFEQFAPFVYSDGDLIDDPTNVKYPRITYSYSVTDAFINSLTVFQVWDWSFNSARLFSICNAIAEVVPVEAGTAIFIPGEVYHEYKNPITGIWSRFEIGDFQAIADQFAPTLIEWRRVEKESAGQLSIWRGSPFLTPRASDEPLSRIMYGTLACRYRTIV